MPAKLYRQNAAIEQLGIKTINGDQLRSIVAENSAKYLLINVDQLKPHAFPTSENDHQALRKSLEDMVKNPRLDPRVAMAFFQFAQHLVAPAKKNAAAKTDLFAGHEELRQRNQQREGDLRDFILQGATWLTSRELSDKANFKNANRSAGPNAWKRRGRTFAISVGGHDLYPAYGFDQAWQPLPIMKRILDIFANMRSPWSLAMWFGTANGWLNGSMPKDLLRQAPDSVLKAAREEKEGAQHG